MGVKRLRDLPRDRRGAITTEYLVVTALGLFIAIGLGALGVTLVDGFGASLQLLYADTP